jgi:putative tryptophan/tyrosine transport system substrate-binding protein
MDRRRFLLTSLSGLAAPPSLQAQSVAKLLRVGLLSGGAPRSTPSYQALEATLRSLGYVDGETMRFEFRNAEGKIERLPGLAADLVRSGIDLIVAPGSEATLQAARGATTTLPIVMVAIDYDPIARGYIAGLARPGGNITGVFLRQLELTSKRLELAKEAVSKATRMAVLWDASSADQLEAAEMTARALGISLLALELRHPPYDYASVLQTAVRNRVGAAFVLTSVAVFNDRARIAAVARQHRLPTIFAFREHVEAGGLLAYGANIADMFRTAAVYVDRIHRGTKPADLPVEQPTKFELVINLKTAKALGLTIPPSMLARADQVID